MTLKELSQMALAEQRKAYPNAPEHALFKKSYSDKKANGLTKAILDYFKFVGVYAERRGTEGRYRQGQSVTDVIGRARVMKGTFIPAHSTGEGDIEVVYKGKKISIEIKIGSDKQRDNQKDYERRLTAAGGVYVIIKSWPEFWAWWSKFSLPNNRGRNR